jgi:hypothetical protein
MLQNYEAVVVTTDGTYRAYHAAETVICVTEDGIEGIIDFIYQDENEPVQGAPEMLVTVLIAWASISCRRRYTPEGNDPSTKTSTSNPKPRRAAMTASSTRENSSRIVTPRRTLDDRCAARNRTVSSASSQYGAI